MRRGGHYLRAPWRRRDDPTRSFISFEKLEARTYRLLAALAAFSIALSIIVWNLRHHDLQSAKPGFVFPLYQYYRQLPNASEGEMWRRSSAANGRGLQAVPPPFFKLREKFFIEMKLGARAQTFYFVIDTGSRHSWVYCKVPGHVLDIENLGPNGLFEPGRDAMVKCSGKDYHLCQQLQHLHIEPCSLEHNFDCLLWIAYADSSRFAGPFVSETLKLPTQDKRARYREVNAHGLFGCVTQKKFIGERVPLFNDGLIGLGNCAMTLVDQWNEEKLISQYTIGICIAKEVQPELFDTKKQVGYVSVGADFKDKFDESNLEWAKLTKGIGANCGIIVTLLFIIFENKIIKLFHSPPTIGTPLVFDTGSDITYLDSVSYDPLIGEKILNSSVNQTIRKQLDFYVIERGYNEVLGDLQFKERDRRRCWKGPEDIVTSPIHNFPLIKFGIEGIPSDSKNNHHQFMTLHPRNYLEWDENEKRLCVNILWEHVRGKSCLGAAQLREHLIMIDYNNQRIRWEPHLCAL